MSVASRAWVVLAVAVGGALGTIVRYELALAEPVGTGHFPWATFSVNVVGFVPAGRGRDRPGRTVATDPVLRPFVAVGFCGGLTTFSTWMVESVLLVATITHGLAVVYLVVSLVAGFAAVAAACRSPSPDAAPGGTAFDPRADD